MSQILKLREEFCTLLHCYTKSVYRLSKTKYELSGLLRKA